MPNDIEPRVMLALEVANELGVEDLEDVAWWQLKYELSQQKDEMTAQEVADFQSSIWWRAGELASPHSLA